MASKPLKWRAQWDLPDGTRHEVHNLGTFDELCVGELIHVEAMDERSYFVSVGCLALWVHRAKNGDTHVTHAEVRGEDKDNERALKECLSEMLAGRPVESLVTRRWRKPNAQ